MEFLCLDASYHPESSRKRCTSLQFILGESAVERSVVAEGGGGVPDTLAELGDLQPLRVRVHQRNSVSIAR